ncbi:MAG: DNA-protecting protein DprA [Acidimicrobiia bacterium]|nr:DNA-protecting protein DprA [Acidimicrobiia bacterium]MYC57267.1 DNA-protecting protein DprA [Acidimicrobiia bacterium]MYI30943.1 DNA-protecting protein DprA [Acidimicrobiia bacterium]
MPADVCSASVQGMKSFQDTVSKQDVPKQDLPPEAWLVALASLPAVGPMRLRALLDIAGPQTVWGRLLSSGDAELAQVAGSTDLLASWCRCACELDVALLWCLHQNKAIGVTAWGTPSYPEVLSDDIEPPAVLFYQGDLSVAVGPRVALVGTRRCTRYGSEVAFELGRDLAKAGVAVVSGLALGIDGAAHAGALEACAAPPIAVVGSGLDRVYPERNRSLWQAVAAAGVLLGEAPLGAAPERWRFPARNRIIAALADVVVVVESHSAGGSMHTVAEALKRDRYVMAVPGPVRSSASGGCIDLLADGGAPCRDASDVLLALGASLFESPKLDTRKPPDAIEQQVLDALGWQPADPEQIKLRSGLTMAQVACAIEELRAAGWVAISGRWIEQVAR